MAAFSSFGFRKVWTALAWFRRSRVGRMVSQALALALLSFLGARFWRLWGSSGINLHDVHPGLAVAAVGVSAVAVASYGGVWLFVLHRLGIQVRPMQLALFFKSQLGKYVPGSVWQYAGRVGLGRGHEIPANVGLASIAVEVAASLAVALIAGSLVLSVWVALVAVTAAVAVTALVVRMRAWVAKITGALPRMDGPLVSNSARVIPLVLPLYGLVWLAYGMAFWLTARALFSVPGGDVPLYVGVFALSWAVGFVAIFAPGGVGVREAVIVGLLAGHLGEARAIVLAAASRVVLTAIDLVLGAIAVASTGWQAPNTRGLEVRR